MTMLQPLTSRRDYDSYPKVVEDKMKEPAIGMSEAPEKLITINYDDLKVAPSDSPALLPVTPPAIIEQDAMPLNEEPMPMTCPYCGGKKPMDSSVLKRASAVICPSCEHGVPTSTIVATEAGYVSMLLKDAAYSGFNVPDKKDLGQDFKEHLKKEREPAAPNEDRWNKRLKDFHEKEKKKPDYRPTNPYAINNKKLADTDKKLRLILNSINKFPGDVIAKYKVPVMAALQKLLDSGPRFKNQLDFENIKKEVRKITFPLSTEQPILATLINEFLNPMQSYRKLRDIAGKIKESKKDTFSTHPTYKDETNPFNDKDPFEKPERSKEDVDKKVYEKVVESIIDMNKDKTKKGDIPKRLLKGLEAIKERVSKAEYSKLKEDKRLEGMKFASERTLILKKAYDLLDSLIKIIEIGAS